FLLLLSLTLLLGTCYTLFPYTTLFRSNSSYFFGHHIDSLVLKFENGKGYYSTVLSVINNENWIANKSSLILVKSKDVIKEGDIYIYKITQEDYENAHV